MESSINSAILIKYRDNHAKKSGFGKVPSIILTPTAEVDNETLAKYRANHAKLFAPVMRQLRRATEHVWQILLVYHHFLEINKALIVRFKPVSFRDCKLWRQQYHRLGKNRWQLVLLFDTGVVDWDADNEESPVFAVIIPTNHVQTAVRGEKLFYDNRDGTPMIC